jgi:hypothetical protein
VVASGPSGDNIKEQQIRLGHKDTLRILVYGRGEKGALDDIIMRVFF